MGELADKVYAQPRTNDATMQAGDNCELGKEEYELTFYALTAVIAASPLWQGLYPARERFLTFAAVLLLCALMMLQPGRRGAFAWPALVCLAFVGLYVAGTITPTSAQGSLAELISMATFVGVFWAVSTSRPGEQGVLFMVFAVIVSAWLVGMWGLLEQAGLLVADGITQERLAVGFGYPNATASWLALGLVLCIMLPYRSMPRRAVAAAIFLAVPIGAALMISGSRGAWLALVAALLLGLVSSRGLVFAIFGQGIIIGVASLVAAVVFLLSPNSQAVILILFGALGLGLVVALAKTASRFAALVLVVLVVVGGVYFMGRLWQGNSYTLANHAPHDAWKVIRINIPRAQIEEATAFVAELEAYNPTEAAFAGQLSLWTTVAGRTTQRLHREVLKQGSSELHLPLSLPAQAEGVQIVLVNLHARTQVTMHNPHFTFADGRQHIVSAPIFRLLPYQLAVRAQNVDLRLLANDGRREFMADALMLAGNAPWFGRGGGTWRATYAHVQQNLYSTARVHSDYLEVLLDVGAVGLVLCLLMLGAALVPVLLSAKSSHLLRTCALGACVVLVHSGGEALLSFPSVYLGAFALLGAAQTGKRALSNSGAGLRSSWARLARGGMVGMCLCGAVLAGALGVAELWAANPDSEAGLSRALKLNPWQAAWHVDLAELRAARLGERYESVTALYRRARQLEPFSAQYVSHLGLHYARAGNFVAAVPTLIAAIELQPMNILLYENAARMAVQTGEAFYFSSVEEARRYAQKALDVYARAEQVLAQADAEWLRRNPAFRLTPSLTVDVGRARVLMERTAED